MVPLSDNREDNFVAELSMGGYGALKWALRYPDRFAAAASLSGATDVANHLKDGKDREALFHLIFGDRDITDAEDDLLWRSEEHTSELQSRGHLVCCLLLENKYGLV